MIAFDYSAGRIAAATLIAAGCRTVMRYVSTPGNPKNITAAELKELGAAGVSVGLVYETTADWMLGGYQEGVAAARSAREQATAAGYGTSCRLWFAADFDATPAQVLTVLDTLHGCADAEGSANLVGIYGGLAVVRAAADAGFTAPWQTLAWSHGVWDPRAVARQTGQTLTVGGIQVDVNELTTDQLGQWNAPAQTNSTPLEGNMPYLISVTPDPTAKTAPGAPPVANAGIFAVDAGIVTHIPDTTDANNLTARFGAPIVITPAYYEVLLAGQPSGGASAAAIAAELAPLLPGVPTAAANAAATAALIGTDLAGKG